MQASLLPVGAGGLRFTVRGPGARLQGLDGFVAHSRGNVVPLNGTGLQGATTDRPGAGGWSLPS